MATKLGFSVGDGATSQRFKGATDLRKPFDCSDLGDEKTPVAESTIKRDLHPLCQPRGQARPAAGDGIGREESMNQDQVYPGLGL